MTAHNRSYRTGDIVRLNYKGIWGGYHAVVVGRSPALRRGWLLVQISGMTESTAFRADQLELIAGKGK